MTIVLVVSKKAKMLIWYYGRGHPLSVYTKTEKTLIEGVTYFDIEMDQGQRKAIKKERAKLINMMLKEKASGGKTQSPKMTKKERMTCETL